MARPRTKAVLEIPLPEPRSVAIGGKHYRFRRMGELSVFDQQTLAIGFERVAELFANGRFSKGPEYTAEERAEIETTFHQLFTMIVVDVPEAVLKQIGFQDQMNVISFFSREFESSVGPSKNSSRGSRGSTAARRKAG